MSKNEKAVIRPNECSWLRWLMTLVVGTVFGILFTVPLTVLQANPALLAATPFGFMSEQLLLVLSFVPLMLGMVIAIRLVAKTPIRTFIHGEDKKLGSKTKLTILGLYLLGLLLSVLISISTVRPSGVPANQYLISLVVMLLLVWIQTGYEELVFRGVFIRFACGNNIRMSKKAVITGVVSSLLFMCMHFANPEILTQSGVQVVFAALAYFSTAMCMYFANLYFRSLVPGLLIHWLNNMFAFTVIYSAVSVGQPLSLFVDYANPTGLYFLVPTLLAYAPLYIWMVLDHKKNKAAA